MNRKDILELKRRFKKEACTFTKVSGCYVNSEKEILLKFQETFLNLPDDELFKYLEIAKKTLSGKIGNNLLELNFPMNDVSENDKQKLLMMLVKSGLKEEAITAHFYESIIDAYDASGNYLILLFHDVYDVMIKTSDNRKLDESEEIYEYVICAICPVSLSKAGLGYFDEENKIKSRIRDWIVEAPSIGFTYPGFIDRGSDVDTVMYYTKNTKDPHAELMESALGCLPKKTATNQLETFEDIIKNTVSTDEAVCEKVFADVQENLSSMLEQHKETYEDTDEAPITLSKDKVKNLLIDSGVSEEITVQIEKTYTEKFGEEPPLAENLIDTKLVKKNAQKKKEKELLSQIEALESKLEQVEMTPPEPQADASTSEDLALDNTESIELDAEDASNEMEEVLTERTDLESHGQEDTEPPEYDVVLQVKPEKLHTIKTERINGQRCIVVPIGDDEQATINGIDNLL
jgi:hypothetical protein